LSRTLEVKIVGDASSLTRSLNAASQQTRSFGSRLGGVAKTAAKAFGAAGIGAAVVTLKRGFDELGESQKVTAQTEAVLKSTGQAAGVTASEVESLAGALSRKSGVDDEAIQSGQNLLLTFTKVKNEAGAGGKVFDRATAAALDMSVAFGQDLNSSALMVGKALQDPIKGVSALTRVGVSFTQQQKDQIKAMAAAGDTAGAQRLILGELERQVKGSAEAYGSTLPGQLAKARNAFDEMAGQIAAKLLPALTRALDWVNTHWPQISRVFQATADVVTTAISGTVTVLSSVFRFLADNKTAAVAFGTALAGVTTAFVAFNTAMKAAAAAQLIFNAAAAANPYVLLATVIAAAAAAIVGLYLTNEKFRESINNAWAGIQAYVIPIVDATFTYIRRMIEGTLNVIRGIFNVFAGVFTGDWSRAWEGVRQIFTGIWQQMSAPVIAALAIIRPAVENAWTAIQTATDTVWRAIQSLLGAIWGGLRSLATSAFDAVRSVVVAAWNAIETATTSAWNTVKRIVTAAVDAVKAVIRGLVDFIRGIAGAAGEAASSFASAIIAPFRGVLGFLQSVIDKINAVRSALSGGIGTAGPVASGVPGPWGGGRAAGGPVRAGTSYVVGERGPELFVPGRSGMIVPNGGMASMGGGTIVVPITLELDGERLWRGTKRYAQRDLRRNGPLGLG
jgi:phage-related protein